MTATTKTVADLHQELLLGSEILIQSGTATTWLIEIRRKRAGKTIGLEEWTITP